MPPVAKLQWNFQAVLRNACSLSVPVSLSSTFPLASSAYVSLVSQVVGFSRHLLPGFTRLEAV